MKRTVIRRVFSLLLAALLLASLLPALPRAEAAMEVIRINKSNKAKLIDYLARSEPARIILDVDFSEELSFKEYWYEVHGEKILDLNGHDFTPSSNYFIVKDWLMRIHPDATLTILDSASSGVGGLMRLDHEISSQMFPTEDEDFTEVHSLFEVYGKLILNNCNFCAGRGKKVWNYAKCRQILMEFYGTVARVNSGGYLEVNGAHLEAREYHNRDDGLYPAIMAKDGSTVRFNGGSIYTQCGADCFVVEDGADVVVASGSFSCDYHKEYQTTTCVVHTLSSPGRVGLERANLIDDAETSFDQAYDLINAPKLKVTPPCKPVFVFGLSGDMSGPDYYGARHYRVLASYPVLGADPRESYFSVYDESLPGCKRSWSYEWYLMEGNSIVNTFKTDHSWVYLDRDFPGFRPEKNRNYVVACSRWEFVGNTAGSPMAYDGGEPVFVKVVDALSVPYYADDLPPYLNYDPGDEPELRVGVMGGNISCQWQKKPVGGTWTDIPGATYEFCQLPALTAADDGVEYRCVSTNPYGTAESTACRLVLRTVPPVKIELKEIDAPIHGEPLDWTGKTETPNCEIIELKWRDAEGNPLDKTYRPVVNETLLMDAVVLIHGSVGSTDNLYAMLNGVKSDSCKISEDWATVLAFEFRFHFKVKSASDPQQMQIDRVYLNLSEDPEVGHQGGTLSLDEDSAKSCVLVSQSWYDKGKAVASPVLEAGKTYTLKAEIAPAEGCSFSAKPQIRIDGEDADYVKDGKNLIVSQVFTMAYNPFEDITPGSSYYDAVVWATNHEPPIVTGTGESTFNPKGTCTRAEAMTFLWRAKGCPEPESTNCPFTDVKEGSYYYKAVLWGVEQGITKGTSDTAFSPKKPCTRGQVVTFLWRTLGCEEPISNTNPFTDVKEGKSYYTPVLWAVENQITKGTSETTFSPDKECTRGQIVTFLYRALYSHNVLEGDEFLMYVEGSYYITGRGWALGGTVEHGKISKGDRITILSYSDEERQVISQSMEIYSITRNATQVDTASQGDSVYILLRGEPANKNFRPGDAVVQEHSALRSLTGSFSCTVTMKENEVLLPHMTWELRTDTFTTDGWIDFIPGDKVPNGGTVPHVVINQLEFPHLLYVGQTLELWYDDHCRGFVTVTKVVD